MSIINKFPVGSGEANIGSIRLDAYCDDYNFKRICFNSPSPIAQPNFITCIPNAERGKIVNYNPLDLICSYSAYDHFYRTSGLYFEGFPQAVDGIDIIFDINYIKIAENSPYSFMGFSDWIIFLS